MPSALRLFHLRFRTYNLTLSLAHLPSLVSHRRRHFASPHRFIVSLFVIRLPVLLREGRVCVARSLRKINILFAKDFRTGSSSPRTKSDRRIKRIAQSGTKRC